MPSPTPKFFVTTPIYYVNARPHIGHAYTTIVADVLARRHRLLGEDTLFLTGTDEHGQKIERSAAVAGIPPQQFTDQVSAEFRTLWSRMGLMDDPFSKDDPLFQRRFIRTTDPAHKRGAQKLFTELYRRGAIYLSSYTGQYSIGEEMFVEGPPGTLGPDGRPTETVTEENFFFRLSDYQRPLLDLIELDILKITPETSKNEVLSFLRGDVAGAERAARPAPSEHENEPPVSSRAITVAYSDMGHAYVPGAVRDLSVSRSSFTWGIPVPEAIQQEAGVTGNHIIYVWLDALANYMTAIGYGSDEPQEQTEFERYWPADLHLVGKEITRFHCVYWPAFLLAAGLPLPKQITANGWLLFDNAKMSKSRGNIVRTETILDAFGDHVYGKQFPDSTKQERDLFAADVLRYFLLREIPFGQDGSFSFDALVTRYNADLANGYGNQVSRTLNMVQQYFHGHIPVVPDLDPFSFGLDRAQIVLDENQAVISREFERNSFHLVLDFLNALIAANDRAITAEAPWKLAKDPNQRERLATVLWMHSENLRVATLNYFSFMPFTTAKVWAQLGLGDIDLATRSQQLNDLQWGGLQPGTKLGPLAPIFPRADKGLAQIMIDMEESRNNPPPTATHADQPLKAAATPTPSAPVTTSPTDPAAPPRTSASDPAAELAGTLPVGGSTAAAATLPVTPGPHTEAPASGVFAASSISSVSPATLGSADTQPQAEPQIAIDDFLKVELRVAQILVAERIPKADKLLRLEVDLGYEKRQILSGIAQWYTPEELVGRRIAVVANLAPRKMRGLESHGMLLAASTGPDDKPLLATFGEETALGARVR